MVGASVKGCWLGNLQWGSPSGTVVADRQGISQRRGVSALAVQGEKAEGQARRPWARSVHGQEQANGGRLTGCLHRIAGHIRCREKANTITLEWLERESEEPDKSSWN